MFGLFKNKRKQFNGLVDTKLNNDYQIQTRDNSKFPGVIAYLEFLDIAVSARMNETEAAMYIATMYFYGLCKHGHAQEARRLIPLTQVRLYVVAWRCRRSDFCSGFRAG